VLLRGNSESGIRWIVLLGLANIITMYVSMVTFNRFILDKTLSRCIKNPAATSQAYT
jgi:hypothetical protein